LITFNNTSTCLALSKFTRTFAVILYTQTIIKIQSNDIDSDNNRYHWQSRTNSERNDVVLTHHMAVV